MNIQKVITLMGDRIYLSFSVDENHTFDKDTVSMWFEDIQGSYIDIGDNYKYITNPENKKDIKEDLKKYFKQADFSYVNFAGTKKLYKELKELLAVMKEYEQVPF